MHSRDQGNASVLQPDRLERSISLIFNIVVYALLGVFFYQAAGTFSEYRPGQRWPLLLSFFRMWTFLPIHEAGHFMFKFFGRTLYILGGSFWQIALPLVWFLVALKKRSYIAPFALFWVGENFMDVSLYIRDAPFRWLPLLGGHASRHDWYNLLSDFDMLDSAETFANISYYAGATVCLGAIGAGLYLAATSFLRPEPVVSPRLPDNSPPVSGLEVLLDESLESKKQKTPRESS